MYKIDSVSDFKYMLFLLGLSQWEGLIFFMENRRGKNRNGNCGT